MALKTDCFQHWGNYHLLRHHKENNNVKLGFFFVCKEKSVLELLCPENIDDFDGEFEFAIVAGYDIVEEKVVAFFESMAHYPYSGQWNGYNPFEFMKQCYINVQDLEGFLVLASSCAADKDWKGLSKFQLQDPNRKAEEQKAPPAKNNNNCNIS